MANNNNNNTILRIGSLRDDCQSEDHVIHRLHDAFYEPKWTEIILWSLQITPGILMALGRLLETRPWNAIKILACSSSSSTSSSSSSSSTSRPISTILTIDKVQSFVLSGPSVDESWFSELNEGLQKSQTLKILRLLAIPFSKLSTTTSTSSSSCGGSYCCPLESLYQNQCLEELDLARCRLGLLEIQCLAKCISKHPKLQKLRLDVCCLQDEPLSYILWACTGSQSLKELHLAHNHCGHKSIQALAVLSTFLCLLDLHHQEFSSSSKTTTTKIKSGWLTLLESVTHSTTLKSLDLSGNKLSILEVVEISKILETNTTLKYMNLQNCQLDDEGIRLLASGIAKVQSQSSQLKGLYLSGNLIMDNGAKALVYGLSKNYVLEEIGHFHYYTCCRELQFYLDCNWAGRRLLQEENVLPPGIWPHVFSRLNHYLPHQLVVDGHESNKSRQESVIYLLLHGPVLLER